MTKYRVLALVAAAAAATYTGCGSSDTGSGGFGGFAAVNGGGGPAAGGMGQAGSPGAGGVNPGTGGTAQGGAAQGGSPGTGGGPSTGGGAGMDAGPDVQFTYDPPMGTGGLSQDSSCADTTVQGMLTTTPADIIVAVDTSGSMSTEAGWTQNAMPNFAQAIINGGIDTHVVMISSCNISVPGPLGSGAGCPGDTNLPNYLHVNAGVGSNNALQVILNTYPQWSSMLRPSSIKSFLVVTDDDSNMNATSFINAVNALDPALITPRSPMSPLGAGQWVFHGIFAFDGPFSSGCFALSAARGDVYFDLTTQMLGLGSDLCQQNFDPVFQLLATTTVMNAGISCNVPMPTTNMGIINPANVRLELTLPPAAPAVLTNVGSVSGCGAGVGGWYYDNPANPTELILCPGICATAQTTNNPEIKVLLGCLGS